MESASSLSHADCNCTSSTDSNQTWMLLSTFQTSFPFNTTLDIQVWGEAHRDMNLSLMQERTYPHRDSLGSGALT